MGKSTMLNYQRVNNDIIYIYCIYIIYTRSLIRVKHPVATCGHMLWQCATPTEHQEMWKVFCKVRDGFGIPPNCRKVAFNHIYNGQSGWLFHIIDVVHTSLCLSLSLFKITYNIYTYLYVIQQGVMIQIDLYFSEGLKATNKLWILGLFLIFAEPPWHWRHFDMCWECGARFERRLPAELAWAAGWGMNLHQFLFNSDGKIGKHPPGVFW
jgi:hypothetical protein